MKRFVILILSVWLVCLHCFTPAISEVRSQKDLVSKIENLAKTIAPSAIEWRRDIHQNPELGNREFRTAKLVAEHLRKLGIEVKTNVAHTGVVGLLRGKKDKPVVALRADMDALPVTEMVDLPFASKVRTTYRGKEVGVMHACGHDVHTSVLMGTAAVLSQMRDELNGSVKFIFQPAEEGAPSGEEGGAYLMIKEGVLENPKPDAIFGLHVGTFPVGIIASRSGALLASPDGLRIVVKGRQTHAAAPWSGVDPIVVASQIVLGLQTIISRQINLTTAPAILSFGSIHGGVRGNIIPDEVELVGTVRTLDPDMRKRIHEKIRTTATNIAESAGAEVDVNIYMGYPVTMNDTVLNEQMLPVLKRVLGEKNVLVIPPITGAEDFSYYAREIPGLFFFLGVNPLNADPEKTAIPHSPYFFVDEGSILVGIRAMANLAALYLENQ